jgi:hypothetical protein
MSGNNKKELAATFSPAEIEAPLYKKWLSAGYFKADAKSKKPAFTIVIPPTKCNWLTSYWSRPRSHNSRFTNSNETNERL